MLDLVGNPNCWFSLAKAQIKVDRLKGTTYDCCGNSPKSTQAAEACCCDGNVTSDNLSRLVGKPTMWFPNRSDTNWPVQSHNKARGLKFRI